MEKIFQQSISSPIGKIIISATESQVISIKIEPNELFSKDSTNKSQITNNIISSNTKVIGNKITKEAARQLSLYFDGKLKNFNLPIQFANNSKSFSAKVRATLYKSEFGATLTYKELAILTANPKACRAVGTSMATNPNPIIVPCHRVLSSNGSIGGFYYGIELKKWLINHEKHIIN